MSRAVGDNLGSSLPTSPKSWAAEAVHQKFSTKNGSITVEMMRSLRKHLGVAAESLLA
jgi:hypothetical protein